MTVGLMAQPTIRFQSRRSSGISMNPYTTEFHREKSYESTPGWPGRQPMTERRDLRGMTPPVPGYAQPEIHTRRYPVAETSVYTAPSGLVRSDISLSDRRGAASGSFGATIPSVGRTSNHERYTSEIVTPFSNRVAGSASTTFYGAPANNDDDDDNGWGEPPVPDTPAGDALLPLMLLALAFAGLKLKH